MVVVASLIYLFIYVFIHLFICLFICLFIYSFNCLFRKECFHHIIISFEKPVSRLEQVVS